MDHHTWADPRHWRCLNLLLLVCLCLIRQHAAYPSMLIDSQVASEDSLDSRNQLDSLSRPPEDDDQDDYKRSSAFFPLRGKKLTLDPELMPEDPEDKRSQFYPLRGKKVPEDLKRASYFMPMRGRKDDEEAWREDLEKRMSSFMPMRGKKSVGVASYQRLGKPGTYAHDILYPSSSGSSRTTSEKEDRRNATEDRRKRSVAFMPMRGRRRVQKEDDGSLGAIATSLLEKKMSSFMPMRGRRFDDEDRSLSSNQSIIHEDDDLEGEKRASSFMPMRGRKSLPDELDYDFDEEDKRGRPSFNAMRGRRGDDVVNRDQRASSFMPMRGRRADEDRTDGDKRMGFFPMRGRRDDDFLEEEDKRSQFMPMRGRRQDNNATDEVLDGRGRRRALFSPVLVSSGIGASLMSRHLFPVSAVRSAWAVRSRKVDWDSVKRGFHATRGKRLDGGCRCKRSLLRPHKHYIALKRPMSFFATRGKRMDSSSLDPISKLR